AKEEYHRVESDPMLTPERAQELLQQIAAKGGPSPATPRVAHNRYMPVMDDLRSQARLAAAAPVQAGAGNGNGSGNGAGDDTVYDEHSAPRGVDGEIALPVLAATEPA
ncbi:MAG: hypothetical protein ACRERC_12505, partial [Candidatus Binatia bacterium]